MIIADENIEQYWIAFLRNRGYEVLSIREQLPGISDEEVAAIAQDTGGLLLTEDKDFGELVFAHGIKGLSVIFLRYDQPNYSRIEKAVLELISGYYQSTQNYFITVTERTVRIRSI
jgi:predicted nuclease of predicted toxin-antitoxin system